MGCLTSVVQCINPLPSAQNEAFDAGITCRDDVHDTFEFSSMETTKPRILMMAEGLTVEEEGEEMLSGNWTTGGIFFNGNNNRVRQRPATTCLTSTNGGGLGTASTT